MKKVKYFIFVLALSNLIITNGCKKSSDDTNQATNRPPTAPTYLTPPNGTLNVEDGNYTWNASTDPDGDPVKYDLYCSTSPDCYDNNTGKIASNLTVCTYPRILIHTVATPYYWFVIAKDNHNNSTKGTLWGFASDYIPDYPSKPTLVYPPNNATNIDPSSDLTLQWDYSGCGLNKFEVNFGTSDPNYIGDQNSSTYHYTINSSQLQRDTKYIWMISAVNNNGGASSDIFTFRTSP